MGLFLIYDIYGTLADIHTEENSIELWRVMKKIIGLKAGKEPSCSARQLRKMYCECCSGELERQSKRMNIPLEYAELRMEEVFDSLLKKCGISMNSDAVMRMTKVFRLLSIERIGVYSGIEKMLREQKEAGFELAILSNAQRAFVEEEFSDILPYFDYVFISSDCLEKKPSPEFLYSLLKKAGRKPEEAVMIGNSAHDDIQMAKLAGLRTIYMSSGIIDEPVPREADAVVKPDNTDRITETVCIWQDMPPYGFYGSDTKAVRSVNAAYARVNDQRHLYRLLSRVWCAETCAPRMRKNWSPENMTLGQCSVTAFLVQDVFGGTVYGIPLKEGGFHCYNDVDGIIFDLTSEQFGNEKLCYTDNPVQFREKHLSSEEKRLRYEKLRNDLNKLLAEGNVL